MTLATANEFSLAALEAMCLTSDVREVVMKEASTLIFPMNTVESIADLFEEIEFELMFETNAQVAQVQVANGGF